MNKPAGNFVRVIIPAPVKESLIYEVPEPFRARIAVGMRVIIPLARRKVTGIVLELLRTASHIQPKEILSVPDERPVVDLALLNLSQWMAQYYLTTVGEALATMLPPTLRRQGQRIVV